MKTSTLITAAAVVTTAGLGVYVAYRMSAPPHQHQLEQRSNEAGEIYYTCPMHPEVRQDEPGNCPICGMRLVQRSEGGAPTDLDVGVVEVAPHMVQNLGLRTAEVRRGDRQRTLEAVGSVRIDERRRVTVESRTAGWIETLAVRAEGDPVRQGQALATLYSPELLAAERELALARDRGDAALVTASRERLQRLAGGRDTTLRAPSDGIVTALMAREGAQLSPGMPLMEIADLSTVWILVDIPEAQSAGLAVDQPAEAWLPALPGERFQGRIDYLYPELVAETRSLRARLVFDNAEGRLRPGMYARVQIERERAEDQLLIPSEALIRTGRRNVVMLAEEAGRYRPVHVVPGEDLGDETVILEGLSEGQRVVVSGQFLLDSEASLLGAYRRLSPLDEPEPGAMPNDRARDHEGMDHHGMEHGGTPAESRSHEGMNHDGMEHGGAPAESRAQEDRHHEGMEHGGTPAQSRPDAEMDHDGMDHDGMEHGGKPAEHAPEASEADAANRGGTR